MNISTYAIHWKIGSTIVGFINYESIIKYIYITCQTTRGKLF